MSLTSELKRESSPTRVFMEQCFPNTRLVVREANAQLEGAATIRPNAPPGARVPWPTLGHAIDYRVRYYVAITDPQDLVAWLGAAIAAERAPQPALEAWAHPLRQRLIPAGTALLPPAVLTAFWTELRALMSAVQPVGRRLHWADEERVLRFCVVLSWLEEVYRGGLRPTSPLCDARGHSDLSTLLGLVEMYWLEDLCAMSWLFYERWGARLNGQAVCNPTFDGSADVGGADADLILERCLWDIKATINPGVDKLWLYQLLGYALLDYWNEHNLDAVGLYFARQGVAITWPLPELLSTLSGVPRLSLEDYRARFRCLDHGPATEGLYGE